MANTKDIDTLKKLNQILRVRFDNKNKTFDKNNLLLYCDNDKAIAPKQYFKIVEVNNRYYLAECNKSGFTKREIYEKGDSLASYSNGELKDFAKNMLIVEVS